MGKHMAIKTADNQERYLRSKDGVRTIVSVRSCDSGIQGVESLILALAQELGAQGVRYIIVNLWDGNPPRVALHEEAIRRGFESHIVATSTDLDPAILPRLAVLLQRLNPDLIQTHDFKSDMTVLVANQFTHAPAISSFYGRLAIGSFVVKFEDWIRLAAFRCFDGVLANSRVQYEELLRWRVPSNRISILHSFVDTRHIKPATLSERLAARRRLGIESTRPVLATVARLSPNKGHRYMIQALIEIRRHFPDVLYLVPGEGDMAWRGDGGLRGELERQVSSLGLSDNVQFLGYYPDLQTILAATDLLVSPSLREGMQVSLLEAMAAGRPIVATAIGGTPEAVDDGQTGMLVPPADPVALALAVVQLLGDPDRMQQMGQLARRRAEEEFDTQVQATRLLNFCAKVIRRA